MIVPDVNLLVYAYDETSPHHAKAKAWWVDLLSGDEPVGIPWVVVLAFTRLMTHPSVCSNPLSAQAVRRRVEHWLAQEQVRLLVPTESTLVRFFDLLEEARQGGNLATDSLIAAHALEHAAVVHTADFDFGRFHGLRVLKPLEVPKGKSAAN
jgi:toxin-antitoxin system PIN domain toxin